MQVLGGGVECLNYMPCVFKLIKYIVNKGVPIITNKFVMMGTPLFMVCVFVCICAWVCICLCVHACLPACLPACMCFCRVFCQHSWLRKILWYVLAHQNTSRVFEHMCHGYPRDTYVYTRIVAVQAEIYFLIWTIDQNTYVCMHV